MAHALLAIPGHLISMQAVQLLREYELDVVAELTTNEMNLSFGCLQKVDRVIQFVRTQNEGVLFAGEKAEQVSIPSEVEAHKAYGFDGKTFDFINIVDGEFQLTKEARRFLEGVQDIPVAAITVVGRYRSGKSYLLNNLAGMECRPRQALSDEACNFSVSQAPYSETLGMRAYPLFLDSQSNPEFFPSRWPSMYTRTCLLLVDSQGLADVYQHDGANFDAKLLSLSLLISSLLIVNVMNSSGAPQRDDLEHLGVVTEVTNNLKVGPLEETSTLSQKDLLHNVFPDLLWLSRNVTDLFDKPPTEFFMDILNATDGSPKINTERHAIKQSFDKIEMYLLSNPETGADPNHERFSRESWSPRFRTEFAGLVKLILSMVKLKRRYQPGEGHTEFIANGGEFLNFLEPLILSANQNDLPDFTFAAKKLEDSKRTQIASEAEHAFNKEMDKLSEPLRAEELESMFHRVIANVRKEYYNTINLEKMTDEFEERIGLSIYGEELPKKKKHTRRAFYISENDKKAEGFNLILARKLYEPIRNRVDRGEFVNSEDFSNAVEDAVASYNTGAKGSNKLIKKVIRNYETDVISQDEKTMTMVKKGGGNAFAVGIEETQRMYEKDRELKREGAVQRLRNNVAQKKRIVLSAQHQQTLFEQRNGKKDDRSLTGRAHEIELEEKYEREKREQDSLDQRIQAQAKRNREWQKESIKMQKEMEELRKIDLSERERQCREWDKEYERAGKNPERYERERREKERKGKGKKEKKRAPGTADPRMSDGASSAKIEQEAPCKVM